MNERRWATILRTTLGHNRLKLFHSPGKGSCLGTCEINIQQPVIATASSEQIHLQTKETIQVKGLDHYQLPEGVVHSCYPEEGGTIESRILPHVVLSDPHIPCELIPDGVGKLGDALLGSVPRPFRSPNWERGGEGTGHCAFPVSGSHTAFAVNKSLGCPGESYGILLGHRTGPLGIQAPVSAYVHLVSHGVAIFVDLSWVPDHNAEIRGITHDLSEQVRPMATKARPLGSQDEEGANWLTKWMESGYTLVKHRLATGEPAPALCRGPLVPQRPHGNEVPLTEATNHGSGLHIIDSTTGLLDISYSTAWNLGRSLAIDNMDFAAALSRLRAKLSHLCRTEPQAPKQAPLNPATPGLPDWVPRLRELAGGIGQTTDGTQLQTPPASVSSRWGSRMRPRDSTPEVHIPSPDRRAGLAAVREMLEKEIEMLTDDKARHTRGWSKPTDAALFLPEIVDFVCNELLTLRAVPHNYLFMEPDILDTEAVLTFYIDPLWLDAMVDGALSLGNHQTLDGDMAKTEIKRATNSFVVFAAGEQRRVPVWGAVVCGKILHSFPNPSVFTGEGPQTPSPELVAGTRLHESALLLLFNCLPEDLPRGFTISQPPHQPRFAAATVLKPGAIRIDLPSVRCKDGDDAVQNLLSIPAIDDGPDSDAVDFTTRCLKPSNIVRRYAKAAKDTAQGRRSTGSFDELGSSALMALALSDKPLELVVLLTKAQGEAGRAAPFTPFQLRVQQDEDVAQSGDGAVSDMRTLA